jgi:NADPH:quinone reductase-like Zn-dependent oxidoreductase
MRAIVQTGYGSPDPLKLREVETPAVGADEVIDHEAEDFTSPGDRWDDIFNIGGNRPFSRCRGVLAPDAMTSSEYRRNTSIEDMHGIVRGETARSR